MFNRGPLQEDDYADANAPSGSIAPPGTCPVCGNVGVDKWRYGRVSALMLCDRCAKYEDRKGVPRPPKLEVRRHERALSDALGPGYGFHRPASAAPTSRPPPPPDPGRPPQTYYNPYVGPSNPGYAPPAAYQSVNPEFVNWTDQHPQHMAPQRSSTPGPDYIRPRANRAPPGTFIVGTPESQGVIKLPSLRSPSAPPAPALEDCPNCHGPMVTKWRWGPVSQKMVCHPCALYEIRNGRLRDIGLEVRKTLRMYGGGLR
ncbi:hypothetical protein MKEN_00989800 [Mycena kentingensis (nom. inval.)]|nr:hypothetical protein MKEN_00989800 [Mycena kentingensis (nom. inval.)]